MVLRDAHGVGKAGEGRWVPTGQYIQLLAGLVVAAGAAYVALQRGTGGVRPCRGMGEGDTVHVAHLSARENLHTEQRSARTCHVAVRVDAELRKQQPPTYMRR
jgi:hypothetical protein